MMCKMMKVLPMCKMMEILRVFLTLYKNQVKMSHEPKQDITPCTRRYKENLLDLRLSRGLGYHVRSTM